MKKQLDYTKINEEDYEFMWLVIKIMLFIGIGLLSAYGFTSFMQYFVEFTSKGQ